MLVLVYLMTLLSSATASTYTLTADTDRDVYGANETIVMFGTVMDGVMPVVNAEVTINVYNNAGGFEKYGTVYTDISGEFEWSVIISSSPSIGLWTAYVMASGHTRVLQFTVSDAPPVLSNLQVSSNLVGYGMTSTLSADSNKNNVWYVKVHSGTISGTVVRDLSNELGAGTTATHLEVEFDGKDELGVDLEHGIYVVEIYSVSAGATSNVLQATLEVSMYPCVITEVFFTNMNNVPLNSISASQYFYINVTVENRTPDELEGLIVLAYGREGYTYEDMGAYYGRILSGEQTISLLFKSPSTMAGNWEACANVWNNWQYNNTNFKKYAETIIQSFP